MNKSEKIAAQIARLEEEKRAALSEERRVDQAELLRLVDRAECLPEALEWVRARGGRRGSKPAKNQQEVQ